MAPVADVDLISDYLIWLAHEKGDYLTNKKLQKLLYYAQAWYLVFNNQMLFNSSIEAWVHGPVVPCVYKRFKIFKFNPISRDIKEPDLHQKIKKHLNEIMEVYGGYSAFQLETMVHNEDPWKQARMGISADTPSYNNIDIKLMMTFYKHVLEKSKNGEKK